MIKTPRLIISPLTKSDCADIHYKNSFSEVAAFNTIGIPKNLKVTEDFLQPLFKPQDTENVPFESLQLLSLIYGSCFYSVYNDCLINNYVGIK